MEISILTRHYIPPRHTFSKSSCSIKTWIIEWGQPQFSEYTQSSFDALGIIASSLQIAVLGTRVLHANGNVAADRIGAEPRQTDGSTIAGDSSFHKCCPGLSGYQNFSLSLRKPDEAPDRNQSPTTHWKRLKFHPWQGLPWCGSCGYSFALLRFRFWRGVLWEYRFDHETVVFPWGCKPNFPACTFASLLANGQGFIRTTNSSKPLSRFDWARSLFEIELYQSPRLLIEVEDVVRKRQPFG